MLGSSACDVVSDDANDRRLGSEREVYNLGEWVRKFFLEKIGIYAQFSHGLPSSRDWGAAGCTSPSATLKLYIGCLIRACVSLTADFKRDLQVDMLEAVQIMEAAEEEFAIEIPSSEVDKISSTSQLIEYITANPQSK